MVEHEAAGDIRLIDHLVYATPTLERGIREMRNLLGVEPVIGGRHAKYGTHNALLSLGPATYLEIVARDPDLPLPERGAWIDLGENENPRLATWVLRAERIEDAVAAASDIGLGPIATGSRETPAGSILSWRLTDPYAMPLEGAVPFLISWGAAPHPAASAPHCGTLRSLTLAHPQPKRVSDALKKLAVDLDVVDADRAGLVAVIETRDGTIELR